MYITVYSVKKKRVEIVYIYSSLYYKTHLKLFKAREQRGNLFMSIFFPNFQI